MNPSPMRIYGKLVEMARGWTTLRPSVTPPAPGSAILKLKPEEREALQKLKSDDTKTYGYSDMNLLQKPLVDHGQRIVCSGTGVSDCDSLATHERETWHGNEWKPVCTAHAKYYQECGCKTRELTINQD